MSSDELPGTEEADVRESLTDEEREALAAPITRVRYCDIETFIGKRYGRLVVVGDAGSWNSVRRLRCRCDCGETILPLANMLVSGRTWQCRKCSERMYRKRASDRKRRKK